MIARIVVGIIVQGINMFFYALFHKMERGNICEIGYRLREKRNPMPPKMQTLWDRLLYWNLCKNARFDRRIVWIYFSLNILTIVGAVISVVLAIFITMYVDKFSDVILYQLGYFVTFLEIWALLHFVIDIFFLPSERKRYGWAGKKQKRKNKSGR